jgi:hypothetical protein
MGSHFSADDFDQEEAFKYRPGQRVELKANPGVVDVILEYDPMMVPPIWLTNDPKPHYAHELNLLPMPVLGSSWLTRPRRGSAKHPAKQSRAPFAASSK